MRSSVTRRIPASLFVSDAVMQDMKIHCQKVKTHHKLLWTENPRKWHVTAVNDTPSAVYLSWSESFVNPFTNQLWIKSIDETPGAGNRMIAELDGGICASFVTTGDKDRVVAPDRFVQIAIPPRQTATWIMERGRKEYWEGFNIYTSSLVDLIRNQRQLPVPQSNVMPRISGWWWA